MSAKATWRELWVKTVLCRRYGHLPGERLWWGDAQRERGGTTRCTRCGSICAHREASDG